MLWDNNESWPSTADCTAPSLICFCLQNVKAMSLIKTLCCSIILTLLHQFSTDVLQLTHICLCVCFRLQLFELPLALHYMLNSPLLLLGNLILYGPGQPEMKRLSELQVFNWQPQLTPWKSLQISYLYLNVKSLNKNGENKAIVLSFS